MVALLITVCIILSASASFFFYRAWKLSGDLVDQKEDSDEYIYVMEQTLAYVYTKVEEAYKEMEVIDRLGSFKSDDEVGTTFALLKQIIDDLEEKVNGAQKEEE